MRFLLALFALTFAEPSHASTMRIDISGYFETVGLRNIIDSSTYPSTYNLDVDPFDPILDANERLEVYRSTTGTAYLTDSNYSDCSGLLMALCYMTKGTHSDPVSGVSVSEAFLADDTRMLFTTDYGNTWFVDGQKRVASYARSIGVVTSLSLTEVPLPASGLLLTPALVLLLRRPRQGRPKRRFRAAQ